MPNEYPRPITRQPAKKGKVNPYELLRRGRVSRFHGHAWSAAESRLGFAAQRERLANATTSRHFSKDRQGRIFMGAQHPKAAKGRALCSFGQARHLPRQGRGKPSCLSSFCSPTCQGQPMVPEIFDYYGQVEGRSASASPPCSGKP